MAAGDGAEEGEGGEGVDADGLVGGASCEKGKGMVGGAEPGAGQGRRFEWREGREDSGKVG